MGTALLGEVNHDDNAVMLAATAQIMSKQQEEIDDDKTEDFTIHTGSDTG